MQGRNHRSDSEGKLISHRDIQKDADHRQQQRDHGGPLDFLSDGRPHPFGADDLELRVRKLLLQRLADFFTAVIRRENLECLAPAAGDGLLILNRDILAGDRTHLVLFHPLGEVER